MYELLGHLLYFYFQEAIAIARLKRDLLTVTGNVHFYKEKDDYIVFKTQDQQPVPDETTESTCNQTNA